MQVQKQNFRIKHLHASELNEPQFYYSDQINWIYNRLGVKVITNIIRVS